MKLNREEHEARAMLMGLQYDYEIHTYYSGNPFTPNEVNKLSGANDNSDIDADTLEPLTLFQIQERQSKYEQQLEDDRRAKPKQPAP